jgi:uncharacterized protein
MLYAHNRATVAALFISLIAVTACNKRTKSHTIGNNKTMNKQSNTPYHVEDVTYNNAAAGITLAGTLTIPNTPGQHPAVILIAGMGPVDRDYTFGNHKMFAVLADHLTHNGIAVLRFDKRGVGQSTGTFDLNVTSQGLASDVVAGIEYLKSRPEINTQQIGLAGHSEGGFIASMLASQEHDLAFVVLMDGAVANSTDILVAQTAIQLKADGASDAMIASDSALRTQVLDIIKQHADPVETEALLKETAARYFDSLPVAQQEESRHLLFAFSPENTEEQLPMTNSPWYRFLLTYNSSAALARITIPLLAFYGERDFMAPHLMLPFIRMAMEKSGNKDYTLLALPNLNHSMQTCVTGAIAEYATITETIAPVALQTITSWIVAHTIDKQ